MKSQSPRNNRTTHTSYIDIYIGSYFKYQISKKRKYLRRVYYNKNPQEICIYERVTSDDSIKKIENRSDNWDLVNKYSVNKYSEKYYIFKQKNAFGKPLGNIKIIDKSKCEVHTSFFGEPAVDALLEDYIYYTKKESRE